MLNEIGSLFGVLKYVSHVLQNTEKSDIVVKKFTFAISSPDEFLYLLLQSEISGRP